MELQALTLMLGLLLLPPQGGAGAQSGVVTPPVQTGVEGVDLGVSLDRIQEAVSRPPAITMTTARPVFRVEIFDRRPTVEDILGPDYLRGPVPAAGLLHQEFLDMVTPDEYRGVAMFSNKEAMTITATSLALQWALMKAVDKVKEARNERAKEAARKEVMEAMNAIEAARKRKEGGS